jgi:acetyl esterase
VSRAQKLVEKVQGRVYATLMGLPLPLQRVLAGRPVVRDGQTLATDTQLSLRLLRLDPSPRPEDLPIPQGRDQLLRMQVIAGGDQPVGAVRDVAVGDLPGRLYTPSGASVPGPLLVFFHGGGWIYGDLDSHDAGCRFLAEQAGVRILSVHYRLAPEHPFPAAYDDTIDAFRWAVKNADALGADPARLGVGGDSAGGTLAATTAIEAAREGLPLAFQLLIYPGTDMRGRSESRTLFGEGLVLTTKFMDLAKASYVPDEALHTDPRVSPLLADLPDGLAPAYVVTAGFDALRDEGEAYARKLADAGVPVELRRFPDQIHGFFHIVGVGHTSREAMAEIADRLRGLSARG